MSAATKFWDGPCYSDDMLTVWLARDGRTRGKAKQIAADEIGCDFTEIRSVRREWMRPLEHGEFGYSDNGNWWECDADHPNAVAVWRCSMEPHESPVEGQEARA